MHGCSIFISRANQRLGTQRRAYRGHQPAVVIFFFFAASLVQSRNTAVHLPHGARVLSCANYLRRGRVHSSENYHNFEITVSFDPSARKVISNERLAAINEGHRNPCLTSQPPPPPPALSPLLFLLSSRNRWAASSGS